MNILERCIKNTTNTKLKTSYNQLLNLMEEFNLIVDEEIKSLEIEDYLNKYIGFWPTFGFVFRNKKGRVVLYTIVNYDGFFYGVVIIDEDLYYGNHDFYISEIKTYLKRHWDLIK